MNTTRLPLPIKALVDSSAQSLFKLRLAIDQRVQRIASLEDSIPRSIRFQCSLIVSAPLREANPVEVAQHTDAFNTILEDTQRQLKEHIVWAAKEELNIIKMKRQQQKACFIEDLTRLCASMFISTTAQATPDLFKQKLHSFKQLIEADNEDECASYHHAFFHFVRAERLLSSILRKKIEDVALSNTVKQINKDKRRAAQQTAEEMELDLPNSELVGNLIDRKLAAEMSRINKRLAHFEKTARTATSSSSSTQKKHPVQQHPKQSVRSKAPKAKSIRNRHGPGGQMKAPTLRPQHSRQQQQPRQQHINAKVHNTDSPLPKKPKPNVRVANNAKERRFVQKKQRTVGAGQKRHSS